MNPQSSPTTRLVRFLLPGLCAAAIGFAPLTAQPYGYNQLNDKNYINNTGVLERTLGASSSNNQSLKITAPRAQVSATFTTKTITVDGVHTAGEGWDDPGVIAYPITNKFNAALTALLPTATAQGTLRLLWNGPVLYGLVEVTGDSTKSDTATPTWSVNSYTPTSDGLFVFMDVFNDQWGMEGDTQGVFFGPAKSTAAPTSFNNSSIPSLGSFFNTANQDYSTRLMAFKSSGYVAGAGVNYTYEFALQIEGWGDAWARQLTNGTKIGLEVGIFDQGASFTYLSKTLYYGDQEGGSNLPNSERIRNRDWAEVTLSGWDGVTPFAYSGWRADEDIRFWNSKSNPGGTGAVDSGDASLAWTPGSKSNMVNAKNTYAALKASGTATRADMETAVQAVCQAFAGLRWAHNGSSWWSGVNYPDPHDLPALQTLPNVWKFYDPTKGMGGMVTNMSEWQQRKQELRQLAQFYEYGYKPQLGVDYTIDLTSIATTNTVGSGITSATIVAKVTPTNVHYTGGAFQNVTVTIPLPTAAQIQPGETKVPVGFGTGMIANGIADISAIPTWGSDTRTDAYAWGTRTGTFYSLFPYNRNSATADTSVTMAEATAVSVYLDILQAACAANADLNAKLDPTKALVKGFSFQAKYAFLAGVMDDRVKVVIAGGAGATGPANWRYNCQGQEYSFPNSGATAAYYNAGADSIVSHGTEGPGNSYRHNRVRETELFRHFMPYGHMYAHEEGSYAYASYSRLPFDNALLVACLAPDRAIIIDSNLNDYNDGAFTDNMALQVARFVYKGLSANSDDYVKFNIGSYVSSGDPHGQASATPEGHYVSDHLFGTNALTTAEATRINTDPYNLNICNGQTQTPYDYYWKGFNTITGGTGGVAGTDGWYAYYISAPAITQSPVIQTAVVGDTITFTVVAIGGGTLTYQWRKDGVGLGVGGIASGVTLPTLTLTGVTTANAGTYDCVVTNPIGSTNSGAAMLTVNRAVAQVTLQSLSATYDGTPRAAAALTTPAGLNVSFTYNGSTTAPVDIGSYAVVATVTDPNYSGTATGTFVITQAPATVTLGSLTQIYDGTPRVATATTSPAGLGVQLTYNGSTTAPMNAGSYGVVGTIGDPRYLGSASGTLVIAQARQTVSFAAVGSVTIGVPVALSATASSGLPVTFSVVSGPATTSGASLTVTGVGDVTVLAIQSGNTNYLPASADRTIAGTARLDQTIAFAAISDRRADAAPLALTAIASSGLPVTFAIVSGPASIAGTTLTLTGAPGTVTVRASQPGNAAYNAALDVVRTFAVTGTRPLVFFGTLGNTNIAGQIAPDGQSGTLIGTIPGTGDGFVVNFTLNLDGSFTAPATVFANPQSSATAVAADAAPGTEHALVVAATASTRTFRGVWSGGVLSGSLDELGLTFSAVQQPPTGLTVAIAGYYTATSTNTATGSTYSVVGTQGQVYVLAVTPALVTAGTGTVTPNTTQFTVQTPGLATIAATIDAPTTTITGTVTLPDHTTQNFSGLNATTVRTDRLVSLSSRALVNDAIGDAGTLIAGFVIAGAVPKPVLLRAIGPSLAAYGVHNALADPRLTLYDATGHVLLENDNWGGTSALVTTQARLGAFALDPASKDAVLFATLAPGLYTMRVSDSGGQGVALAEIYDASDNPQSEYQRLVDISTRGPVTGGEDVLIGGFMVTGNSPKKVLVRGVGPGLNAYGVSSALTDPLLTVYTAAGVPLAQNDQWETSAPLTGAQTSASPADLSAAFATTGAFALAHGSKDAALIVVLAPGAYTAVVSGVGGQTGVALVEIYEIPPGN